MTTIEPKVLFISSDHAAEGGTYNDFKIDVTNLAREPGRYNRISVLSVNIPKTYYAVDGTLEVTLEGTQHSVEFQGNYSARAFAAALTAALNALNGAVQFAVVFDALLLRYTFSVTGTTTPVTLSSTTLRRPLGFHAAGSTTQCCFEVTPEAPYTTGVALFTIETILLNSSVTNAAQVNQRNILASVPDINTVFGSSIHYETTNAELSARPYRGETELRFFLTDTDGTLVRLNAHWTAEIVFFRV